MKGLAIVGAVLVAFAVLFMIFRKDMNKTSSDNHSAERMKKIRAIKAKKREERNRAQMQKVA